MYCRRRHRMINLVRSSIALFVLVKITVCRECTDVPEYNSLLDLRRYDNCLKVDLVFKYLEQVHIKGGVHCTTHVIDLLAGHFGFYPSIPQKCSCQGVTMLQQYHFGSGDGVYEIRDHCWNAYQSYRDMYYHFFEVKETTNYNKACETHHKVWSALSTIPSAGYQSSSCQRDMIIHLNYAFEQHQDKCICTDASSHVNGHQGHKADPCSQFSSYNRLLELGNTDNCMSANSAWHYLDDLQAKNEECRKKIQNHLATQYRYATSQLHDNCVCHARVHLQNHEIKYMNNGSLLQCRDHTSGYYRDIVQMLFSRIEYHGCMNHYELWPNLENVMQYCYNGYCVDCQQDLIVRAATQYPNEGSDSCVCSRRKLNGNQDTTTSTTTRTPTTTPKATTTRTPTATPTTHLTLTNIVSSTSSKVIQTSTSSLTTKLPVPTQKFTCNKLSVIEDIAKSIKATDPRSSHCDPAAGGSDDAYILSTCRMTSPKTWKRGIHVMADCRSEIQLIPTYTPVSTFESENYTALGSQSGIFLGCINSTGIKIAVQKCNSTPEILNIENGAFANNPNDYYVIV